MMPDRSMRLKSPEDEGVARLGVIVRAVGQPPDHRSYCSHPFRPRYAVSWATFGCTAPHSLSSTYWRLVISSRANSNPALLTEYDAIGPLCLERTRRIPPKPLGVDNREIADRLDAFASLLDLGDANPYTARAYRRAAETIRGLAVPVAELVASGKVRDLRGIGSGIEARLRELVETGEIRELAELERELAPDLIGLGRYLGLSTKRSVDLARALGVHSADELREAAADGRLRDVPGIGPKIESQLLEALAREPDSQPRQGLLLNRALELVGGIASALDGSPAGDVRRWRDSCERLAVVCSAADPEPALSGFASLPKSSPSSSAVSGARSA